MTQPAGRVWLVDDDADLRRSIEWLLRSVGLEVHAYGSATEFLERADLSMHGCLLTDVRMPGLSGIELLERLKAMQTAPVSVVMTLHGDAPTAVRAMKAGAFDFIEKPFREQDLIDAVHRALVHGEKSAVRRSKLLAARSAMAALTPRERDVFDRVSAGRMNKEVARDLNLSVRTVELHRAHVMEKLGAATLSELVMLRLLVDGADDGP